MGNPTGPHLTEEELAALAGGSRQTARHREHLAVCEACRLQAERIRRVEYFLAPGEKQSVNPKEHLTGEALAVLFHGGLSPARAEAASAHLRVCDECLARYESIRRDELASPLPAEVAELAPVGLKRLQRKLREVAPPRGGYLGTVTALRSGGTRSLEFEPAAEGVPTHEAFRGPLRIPAGVLNLEIEPAPGGASCLLLRLWRDDSPVGDAALRAYGDELEMTVRAGSEGWMRVPGCPGRLRVEIAYGAREPLRLDLIFDAE